MSLDTSLIHDGSLHIANANYHNPVTPLAGPGGTGQFLAVMFSASQVLQIQTTPGGPMYGVLQNDPMATDACDVGIVGITKAVAGAAITFGQELMIDASGRFIPWVAVSGTTGGNYKVGMAMETVGAINRLFAMAIYFPNVRWQTL
jgi:hypothetical protein